MQNLPLGVELKKSIPYHGKLAFAIDFSKYVFVPTSYNESPIMKTAVVSASDKLGERITTKKIKTRVLMGLIVMMKPKNMQMI